jgi:hypothetical protein
MRYEKPAPSRHNESAQAATNTILEGFNFTYFDVTNGQIRKKASVTNMIRGRAEAHGSEVNGWRRNTGAFCPLKL